MKSEIQIEPTKRIQWLDVLKGILILFVILSHSYPVEIYERIFTPFFLTMFFFASGYTFSLPNNFLLFFEKKWNRLLRPFLILGTLRIFLSSLLEKGHLLHRLIAFLAQKNCEYDEMWFLSCLFICSLFFYIILKMSKYIPVKYETFFLLGISLFAMLFGMTDIFIWKVKFFWEGEIACLMLFIKHLGTYYTNTPIY